MIYIYTDGACSNNQADENFGGWAALLTYGDYSKEISGSEVNTTNNRMEMMAVIEALKAIKKTDIPIKLFSDSAYIVNCINQKWYLNWQKNGWKNSKKEAVLNQDLWQDMLFEYKKFVKIDFIKVKGHVNPENKDALKANYQKYGKVMGVMSIKEYRKHIEYNNRVDELAVAAAEKVKSNDSIIGK